MPLLSVTNLKYAIGTRVLLDGASFSIENGERVGMVGRNGTGKTTLMKVIMGRVKPDSGTVVLQKGARIGYLSQDPDLNLDNTLRDEAIAGFAELSTLHAELEEVYHAMAEPENGTPERMDRLMRRQSDLQERIEAWGGGGGGYSVDHQAEAILHGLGFVDAQFGVKVRDLSGGQKGRLALAKLLLESPDLLLLDEPTNHLDIAGREWLEEFLIHEYSGAVLMISHDRYMLDRVVDRIEEVEQGRLIEYPGNYTAFIDIRKQRLLTQQRAYENQQSRWAKEEEFIRRFKAGQRAKEAQGRLSKLEREKAEFAIERPVEMAVLRMELPEAPRSSEQVVLVRGAGKWYPPSPPLPTAEARHAANEAGEAELEAKHVRRPEAPGDKVLFRNLDLNIRRGERWGVIGPNGAGKTTLVRAILDELPLSAGHTKIGFNVVPGYFKQLADDEINQDLKVYEYLQLIIRRELPDRPMSEQAARNLAGAFLFSGGDQEKPMKVMSGGERSRARLAGLLASAKNLLVLDEPTNHLDIPSAERLEAALLPTEKGGTYDGTLILISHDRALIDSTCDHLLILDGKGGVTIFHGNYSDWQRKQKEQAGQPTRQTGKWTVAPASNGQSRNAKPAAVPKSAAPAPAAKSEQKSIKKGGKFSWMPMERLETEMAKTADRLKAIDDDLAREEVYRDVKKFQGLLKERETVAAELAQYEEEWLRRAEG
jgi:ATP-binding cassette subfamily F protein 3